MTTFSQPCRICGCQEDHQRYNVREMLFGTRQEFEYLQCASCGCLQLADIPDDLSQFYPSDYCSYKDYRRRTRNVARRVIDTWFVRASLPRDRFTARLLQKIIPPLDYVPWAQYAGVDRKSRILDVGCGNGKLLIRMSMAGFKHLHGVDPFIREDIHIGSNVRIAKMSLREFVESRREKYRLVMLHHSFEHVPDPVETLLDVKQLVEDDGFVLIRIPLADSYSREHYGQDWYSWDAPRHTYLHTVKSMNYLAEKTGLVIRKTDHDATFHQLRNSEMYLQGIPGNQHSRAVGKFTRRQIKEFKTLTKQLNREGRGEQAAFFLQNAGSQGASRRVA